MGPRRHGKRGACRSLFVSSRRFLSPCLAAAACLGRHVDDPCRRHPGSQQRSRRPLRLDRHVQQRVSPRRRERQREGEELHWPEPRPLGCLPVGAPLPRWDASVPHRHPSAVPQFVTNVALWTFHERGALRAKAPVHHIVGQTQPPREYTINEEVVRWPCRRQRRPPALVAKAGSVGPGPAVSSSFLSHSLSLSFSLSLTHTHAHQP